MSDNVSVYALNTGAICNCRLSIQEKIELAAQIGYDGIELWVAEIETGHGLTFSVVDSMRGISRCQTGGNI